MIIAIEFFFYRKLAGQLTPQEAGPISPFTSYPQVYIRLPGK